MMRVILALAVYGLMGCFGTNEDGDNLKNSQILNGLLSTSTDGVYRVGPFTDVSHSTQFDVAVRKTLTSPWTKPLFFVRFDAANHNWAYIEILDSSYFAWYYRAIASP